MGVHPQPLHSTTTATITFPIAFPGWFSGPGSGKAFYKFYGAWWEICKSSDVHYRQVFDSEWNKLLELVPAKNRASEWLQEYVYDTRMKWCYSWTWDCSTLGVHSTQRSESIHSVVASLLSNNSTLIDLITQLERWVETKSHLAQTELYKFCTKVSTGNLRTGRLVKSMLDSFHEHATKLVTANLHRAIEYNVEEIDGASSLFMVKCPIDSIQHSFLGPVQWVGTQLEELNDRDANNVSTSFVGRVDRAAAVHDYFPLIRSHFVSDGKSCTCQYPVMQGLPCEHCLAVLVRLNTEELPDCFLKPTVWHVESDATESEFRRWCLTMQHTPKPAKSLPTSTPETRFNEIMLTAKTLARGYSLLVSDTDFVQSKMAEMCLALKERHDQRQLKQAEAVNTARATKRKCTACQQQGHRADNPKCPKHASHVPSFLDVAPLIRTSEGHVATVPPHLTAAEPVLPSVSAAAAQNADPLPPPDPPLLHASANLDAIAETEDDFAQRLQRSGLVPVRVSGSGECFWTSCLLCLQWLSRRNQRWAAVHQVPATALALRLQVLDFMKVNWTKLWATEDTALNYQETFQISVQDEMQFGVLDGQTNRTTRPSNVTEWFTLMSMQYAYTQISCVVATSFCFGVAIKVFIKGSKYPEAYFPSSAFNQDHKHIHIVDPDTTICFCKRDRIGHFDALQWGANTVFVPNKAGKQGRGRLRQARLKSAIERTPKGKRVSKPPQRFKH